MRLLVAVLVGCALAAGSAGAAGVVGVRDARLSVIASGLVGSPVTVRCTDAGTIGGISGRDTADGAAAITARTIYLEDDWCRQLALVRGKPTALIDFGGYALLAFVHETWHMRGVLDESDTDCHALREMAQVAIQRFGVIDRKWLHTAVGYAWEAHRKAPADYTRLC